MISKGIRPRRAAMISPTRGATLSRSLKTGTTTDNTTSLMLFAPCLLEIVREQWRSITTRRPTRGKGREQQQRHEPGNRRGPEVVGQEVRTAQLLRNAEHQS